MPSLDEAGTDAGTAEDQDHASGIPALSPHPAFAVEWWFCQGQFAGETGGHKEFMISCFDLRPFPDTKKSGTMLLLSIFDPATQRHFARSQVSSGALNGFVSMKSRFEKSGLDSNLVAALIDEIRRYGPPKPIIREESPARITSEPLRIDWGDFHFSQTASGFELRFEAPDGSGPIDLRLQPRSEWWHCADLGIVPEETIAYLSCPRLELRGLCNGEPVRGEAWIDQQWCSSGLFIAGSQHGRFVGWEWFGINLDDGTDLLLIAYRDRGTRRQLSRVAMLFEAGAGVRRLQTFDATPSRYWTSGETRISYPVEWNINIPELALTLRFSPLGANQEIPVFGLNAIWEGAGTVSGQRNGAPVRGRCRLELNGYGSDLDFTKYLTKLKNRANRHVAQFFPKKCGKTTINRLIGPAHWKHCADSYEPMLAQPSWHLLAREGKHWRSVFGILILEAFGVAGGRFEREIALIAELIHTGSLIIDDIEDAALLRRGVQSTHLAFGLDVALNAGNALYFLPLVALEKNPHLTVAQREEMYRVLMSYFVRGHFGQATDIHFSRNMSREKLEQWLRADLAPQILQMYVNKTAGWLMGLTETAAIVAGADAKFRAACLDFARTFGVAFQIVDDIHGLTGMPGSTKTPGEDLITGKLTFVVHAALKRLPAKEQHRLAEILGGRLASEGSPTLQEAIDLVTKSGAIQQCHAEAEQMTRRSWARLSKVVPASRAKTTIRIMLAKLLQV